MDCHSERSETERGNRLLGAKRTTNSALRKSGKQNRRRTRRQEARARACPRSALGANDGGSPNFSPYLRCTRFPPSGAAWPACGLCPRCVRRLRMVLRRFFHKKRQKDSCNEFRNLVWNFSCSSSAVFTVRNIAGLWPARNNNLYRAKRTYSA